MIWLLVLAVLGIAVGVLYLKSKHPTISVADAITGGAKVGPVEPGQAAPSIDAPNRTWVSSDGAQRGVGGSTGFSPPPRVVQNNAGPGLVVPPSTGPAVQARSGKGAF